jgi:putative peptide zinc metalloprotease protein
VSAAGSSSPVSEADLAAIAPPPLRGDLTGTPRRYLGREFVIFKNPISLAFFRLPAAHAEAARLFDGRRPLGEVLDVLAASSRYWKAMGPERALQELSSLAGQLGQSGLLQVRAGSATERAKRLKQLKAKRGFEMAVGHVLFFRKSLIDPDRLLSWLMVRLRWIYRPAVLVGVACFVVFTLGAAVWNFRDLAATGANFFTLSNLGLTWVLFIGVKILHEFGHGITAKRFGAEVHEMGFMFILLTPYLFCNVSDVWREGKGARIATGAAGLVVELVLASTAFWLWFVTQPGLFHQICFNTVVLCSVSTLLFNGNPLMKFDGYYILSDALEIPNLRAKSNAWVTGWAQTKLLGLPPKPSAAPHEESPLFGVYAVAAYFYGWFILFSISAVAFDLLKPYGLEFLSRAYVFLFLFVSLALPLYRLIMSVGGMPAAREAVFRRGRWVAVAAAVVLATLFFVPWQESIRRSAALEHDRVSRVSASAPGVLAELLVSEGERVAAGQLLGRLTNRDLEAQLVALGLDLEALQVRLRALSAEDSEEARLAMPVVARQVREVDEQLQGLAKKAATLELRAPLAGVVRTARPNELVGQFFPAGRPVLEIGGSGPHRLLIALDEQQARKIREGQHVRAVFTGLPGEVFRGTISRVPTSPSTQFSVPALANLFGGDVPAEVRGQGQEPIASVAHYEAEAVLDVDAASAAALRAQNTARARIEIGRTSLAGWLLDRLFEGVSPQIRL